MGFFERPIKAGEPAQDRPYTPSFLADDTLLGEPQQTENPGLLIANGHKPGASNGGMIAIGGRVWGCDFMAMEGDTRIIHLYPTDKDDVYVEQPETNVGTFAGEGVGTLTDHERGLMVLSGIVTAKEWMAENARRKGARISRLPNGLCVVQPGFPVRAQITNIGKDSTIDAELL